MSQLTEEEKSRYQWQIWTSDFGEEGQRRLKESTVLISRCGGVGGVVAYELAAAGVGRLILAHGGNLKPDDLNRQILMTSDWVGKPRIESVVRRLRELNPLVEIVGLGENMNPSLADRWIPEVDLVVDCAPRFEERFAMNQAVVRHHKKMVECAMHDTELHLTSFWPETTPCLACLYPEYPEHWSREFPVFGAVAGTMGALAATEAIKILGKIGSPLYGTMMVGDLRTMEFRRYKIRKSKNCPICNQSKCENH